MSTSEPSVSIFTICALGRTLGDLVSTSTNAVACSPIRPDIQDHGSRGPIRHLILPGQNLPDVVEHCRWALDVHRAPCMRLGVVGGDRLELPTSWV